MQEFRPADAIDADTRLAESLINDDFEALGALISRYRRAVDAVVSNSSELVGDDQVVDVFAQAWLDRRAVDPGSDFAPWLGHIAATSVGQDPADVEQTWVVAMAIDSVDAAARRALRAHHVDGAELPDDANRHELRLLRRLAHLGDDAAVAAALDDPRLWSEPTTDIVGQVRSRLGVDQAGSDIGAQRDEGVVTEQVVPEASSRVTRSLRPVLLGLGGAVVVLFVAIIALSAASGSADPVVLTADLTPTGAIVDVEGGELTVTERDSGLRLDLDAPTLPRRAGDQFYEGVVILQDGTELGIGTFNQGFDVVLSAGVSLDRVEEFLVVARDLGSDDRDVVLKLDVPQG